jgi:ribosome-interacting GTPase 1
LHEKRVTLTDRWGREREAAEVGEDPFALRLPAVLLANRTDLLADVDTEVQAFLELTGIRYPVVAVSATTGRSLCEIGSLLFCRLGIVRVYTKVPGRPPDRDGRSRCAAGKTWRMLRGSCTRIWHAR